MADRAQIDATARNVTGSLYFDELDLTTMISSNETTNVTSDFIHFLYGVATPIIFTSISLIGIVGNSLVIYVILSDRSMRTVTNLLLLNLAIADLCFVVIVPPFTAYQQATSTWPFGEAICVLFHYLVNVTAYVTVYTLVLVSVIRYMTVVHSVQTVRIRTRRNVVAMVTVIWVVVLLVNVPILLFYGVTSDQECKELDVEVGKRVFATFFAFAYLVPLAVIAVFSIAILRHITSQRATSMIHQQQKDKKSRSGVHKVNVSRLLILVIVIFAILWLPVHLHLLMAFYARSEMHESGEYQVVSVLCMSLAYFNSCVNPIIYNRTSKEFRDAFRKAIGCNPRETGTGNATEVAAGRSRKEATSAVTRTTETAAAIAVVVGGGGGGRAAGPSRACITRDADEVNTPARDSKEETELLQPNGASRVAALGLYDGIEPARDAEEPADGNLQEAKEHSNMPSLS